MRCLYKHDIAEDRQGRGIRLGCAAYVLFGGAVLGLAVLAAASSTFFAGRSMESFRSAPQIALLFAALILWVWSPFQSKRLRIRVFPSQLLLVYYGYMNKPDLARFRLVGLGEIAKIERVCFPEFFAHAFPHPDRVRFYLNRRLNREGYDCILVASPHQPQNLKEGIAVTLGGPQGQKVVFECGDADNCIQALKKAQAVRSR